MAALLDRDAELTELGRRLRSARAGSGRVIVVEGPAGIGKSTLLAAAGRMARDDGTAFLLARCSPLEQHAAWGMASQLFEPLRARPEWAELTVGAAGLAERALAPEAGEPAPAGDAMHAAARGLVWLTSNLGERGPAVLAVDDIHWADAPSLRWLAVLARPLDELPVGVLCAVRSGDPAGAPELLAEVLAAAPEPPVRPRTLGPAATGTLVRERLAAASPGFAHACHAVTGGNPFLLARTLDPARRRRGPSRTTRPPRGSRPSGPSRSGACSSASWRGCRPAPERSPAPSASSAPAPAAPRRRTRPARPPAGGPRRRRAPRCRPARPGTRVTLAHPLIAGTLVLQPARRRARASPPGCSRPARARARRT